MPRIRSVDLRGCRLNRMLRPRFCRIAAVALLCAAALTGCAKTGSNRTSCDTTEVSPNSQPGGSTPRAALDRYLKVDRSGLPKGGYVLESHSGSRYVFASGAHRVSVSKLPTDKGAPAVWVALLAYDCS